MKKILLLLFVISLGLSSCKFIKTKILKKKQPVDTMAAYEARLDSIREAETRYLQELEQARLDSIAQAEAETEALQNANKYHVISGSFRTPSYADSYLQKMINNGYAGSKILQANNGFNLVSIASASNMRAALSELRQIKNQTEMELWVYVAH
jgi:cell division protein FtsN